MQSHKLMLEEVEEDHFQLVAIYSSIEDYRIAYLLNKYLKLNLKRERRDVDFNQKNIRALFALYTFKDPTNYRTYHLVANKFKGEAKKVLSSGSLFTEEEVRPLEVQLIPEQKKVDFFLKIEEDINPMQLNRLVNRIGQIPHVQAAYRIDLDQLKSKQNLIFE